MKWMEIKLLSLPYEDVLALCLWLKRLNDMTPGRQSRLCSLFYISV